MAFLSCNGHQLHLPRAREKTPFPAPAKSSPQPNPLLSTTKWVKKGDEGALYPQFFPFAKGFCGLCWHCSNIEITILSGYVTHSSEGFTAVTKLFPLPQCVFNGSQC